MSDSNVTSYKFRSVVLPYSGLEVCGEDWDEFEANLVAAFGDADLAKSYLGMRQFEVKQLVETARNNATGGNTVSPEQGRRNVETQLGAEPLCPGHGLPARKSQVKKDGKNKGKWFYSCNKPTEVSCNFFEWCD